MSTGWSVDELLRARTPEAPSGENLEDTPLLGSLDRFAVFGRHLNYVERGTKDEPEATYEPEWQDVRSIALDALNKSKDLRALVHLGAAALWTDGMTAFVDALAVAPVWLESEWPSVYPRVDDDAMVRQSTLLCFGDSIAILNRLRRASLVRDKLNQPISLRDVEIATGQLQAGSSDRSVGPDVVEAAFADSPIESLQQVAADAARGLDAVKRIGEAMATQADPEWIPDLSQLSAVFYKIDRLVGAKVAARLGVSPDESDSEASAGAAAGPVGVVRSRQDAVRALEAVSAYFRQTEPSSPVPLVVERAKRLVAKDFLEILADIAPDALAQARSVGGLPPSE